MIFIKQLIRFIILSEMHKIGVLMLGKMSDSPKRVKQIILQVQGKTKMSNILQYLVQMGKITNTDYELSLQKYGRPVNDSSNITQALKYATPVNGVLKLYLYQKGQYLNMSMDHLRIEQVKKNKEEKIEQPQHSPRSPSSKVKLAEPVALQSVVKKEEEEGQEPKKGCCCF